MTKQLKLNKKLETPRVTKLKKLVQELEETFKTADEKFVIRNKPLLDELNLRLDEALFKLKE